MSSSKSLGEEMPKTTKTTTKKTTTKKVIAKPVRVYSYTEEINGKWIETQAKKFNLSKAAFVSKVLTSARKGKITSTWK